MWRHLFVVLVAWLATNPAAGQSGENYSSIEAVAGATAQVYIHASATRGCQPAPLPEIRLIERPKGGQLLVRRATLTTDKFKGCQRMSVPAQAVFHTARGDFRG